MAYLIQKEDSEIITVCYAGEVKLQERKIAVDEVCALVNPSNAIKLLIDVTNIRVNMPESDQKIFAGYLSEKNELKNAKVAVLHNPQNNPNIIIGAVAYAKGYFTVNFDNKTNAISWLTGDLH